MNPRCIAWDTAATERVMKAMEVSGLAISYRQLGHMYLGAIATFAKRKSQGYLPASADPLDEVDAPTSRDIETYVGQCA